MRIPVCFCITKWYYELNLHPHYWLNITRCLATSSLHAKLALDNRDLAKKIKSHWHATLSSSGAGLTRMYSAYTTLVVKTTRVLAETSNTDRNRYLLGFKFKKLKLSAYVTA